MAVRARFDAVLGSEASKRTRTVEQIMTNHASRRDRRRFLQESMFATVALAGGMGVPPSALGASAQQARGAARDPSSKSLSREFAEWVVRLRYEDLPAEVIDRAKGLTLQNLASALLGSQMPAGQQAIAFVTDEEGGVNAGGTIMVAGTLQSAQCSRYDTTDVARGGARSLVRHVDRPCRTRGRQHKRTSVGHRRILEILRRQ
jgi:MmgE/PrpD N-terminal domain